MLNEVVMMGRLVRDPEVRSLRDTNNTVTMITLAVERNYKSAGEQKPKTDFINCRAWGKTGEFIAKYFKKGNMIAVTGSIETGSYTNRDGNKVYTTDLRIEKVTFTGERASGAPDNTPDMPEPAPVDENGFMNIPDGIDEELPFN